MTIFDITVGTLFYYLGVGFVLFGGVYGILLLISSIINWFWWKKENRKDFADFRYFLNHKDEIMQYIHGRNK